MRHKTTIIFITFLLLFSNLAIQAARPQVELQTNMGNIVVELASYRAPGTVQNFLRYVDSRFYDNTVIHRVEADFVIQGGGFDSNYEYKETRQGIRNESDNGLENKRGTIAMARTDDVHSANSQFYFNLSDNRSLDARYGRLGYTVFGKVVSGMDVVDAIGKAAVAPVEGVGSTVPVNAVVIKSIRVIEPKAKQAK
jgi:cyclophilin family peptidyl-prolyl cis-trans isomerase